MRIVTIKDFDALGDVMDEVKRKSAEFNRVARGVLGVVNQQAAAGNFDEANAFGGKHLPTLEKELHDLFHELEQAAFNFLGEKRLPDETMPDYVYRVMGIINGVEDVFELAKIMRRNGISLVVG